MTSRFTKFAAAAIAVAVASTALPISTAEAGHRGWGKHHHHHHYHRSRDGSAVAAGIFGLAAGAMLGSALAQPRYHYAPPPRVRYYPPASYAPARWSPEWYSYCASKYRSFNVHTGMYLTYRGDWVYCH